MKRKQTIAVLVAALIFSSSFTACNAGKQENESLKQELEKLKQEGEQINEELVEQQESNKRIMEQIAAQQSSNNTVIQALETLRQNINRLK
jgi:septal ring factor EnvC (AmiA/AmiB activator)